MPAKKPMKKVAGPRRSNYRRSPLGELLAGVRAAAGYEQVELVEEAVKRGITCNTQKISSFESRARKSPSLESMIDIYVGICGLKGNDLARAVQLWACEKSKGKLTEDMLAQGLQVSASNRIKEQGPLAEEIANSLASLGKRDQQDLRNFLEELPHRPKLMGLVQAYVSVTDPE